MKSIILGKIKTNNKNSTEETYAVYKIESIKVEMICDKCQLHIEKVAKSIKGVRKTNWDEKSDLLQIEYDTEKTDLHTIELRIAEAGHDTPHHKKRNKYYTVVPECCQFRISRKPNNFVIR